MRILTYALCDAVMKRVRDALGKRFPVTEANRKALVSPANRDAVYLLNITRSTDGLSFFISYHMYPVLWLLRRRTALFFASDYADLSASRLGKACFHFMNRIVFASARLVLLLPSRRHIAKRYALPPGKVMFMENFPGPAFTKFDGPPAEDLFLGKTALLYHGSVLWWHGFHKFIPIYERLKQTRPDVQLVVMGSAPRNAFLGRFAREREFLAALDELKRRDDIAWIPAESVSPQDVPRYVARADLHVSQLDNQSVQGDTELRTCLLEAMALGVPCLHVDSHAIRTHPEFKDGENIVLIDPDDPDAAARRILTLIDDPAQRARIGENARQTIREHYDFDAWLEGEFIPALERLAGKGDRNGAEGLRLP